MPGVFALTLLLSTLPLIRVEIAADDETAPNQTNTTTIESDERLLLQAVAYPRIVFAPASAQVELFVQQSKDIQYIVQPHTEGVVFALNWDVFWPPGSVGAVELEMLVNVFPPFADDWEEWSAAYDYLERDAASTHTDSLFAPLYLNEPGYHEIAVSVVLTTYAGEEPQVAEDDYFTSVFVLEAYEPIAHDADDHQHPLTGYAEDGILLDGRGWHAHFCEQFVEDEDLQDMLDAICEATQKDEFESAFETLLELTESTEDPLLLAQAHDQLGLIACYFGDWESAAQAFEEARGHWEDELSALHLATTLHNRAVALYLDDNYANGVTTLEMALRLRSQIQDTAGELLSRAQLAVKDEADVTLTTIISELERLNMPQAALLERWLDS